jgi:hypothetical protein
VLVVAWGLGGVAALLMQALVRLYPRAVEAIAGGLDPLQWTLLAGWLVFMGYAEGWRGFHRRFAPRVVRRAFELRQQPDALGVLFAPAYCLSLFRSTRRGKIVSWALLLGIAGLVVLVRQMPQPWRGIVDAGVVVGLGLGLASMGYHAVRAARGTLPPADEPRRARR